LYLTAIFIPSCCNGVSWNDFRALSVPTNKKNIKYYTHNTIDLFVFFGIRKIQDPPNTRVSQHFIFHVH
jgi:hypothetical protein